MKTRVSIIVSGIIVFLIASSITALDYFNVGSSIRTLNETYVSLVWGNIVVIFIFLFTFWKIDARQTEIEKNRSDNAKYFLRKEHVSVAQALSQGFYDADIAPASEQLSKNHPLWNDDDGTWTILSGQVVQKVFLYSDAILQYMIDGVITAEEYSRYVDMKAVVSEYLSMEIFFCPESREYAPITIWKSVLDSWNKFFENENLFTHEEVKDYFLSEEIEHIELGINQELQYASGDSNE